jgi:signal transduction histidine kinase
MKTTLERVESAQAMSAALERGGWDVIIADYCIPGFGGLGALKLMQERGMDMPFILISGAVGEETAVEAMKAGAHDCVLKHNLTRLVPAVTREIREAQVRRERRQAIEAQRELATQCAFLAEASRKLTASLNYEEALAETARVALPGAADWCVVTLVEEESGGLRTVVSHIDSEREATITEYLRRFPPDPLATHGAVQVIRAGQPELTSRETVLVTGAPLDIASAAVCAAGYDSGLCLPLRARGRILGAMTLVRISRERRLSIDALQFAEELAARAAIAIDNALLYRTAREAVRVRDEFLCVASHELNTPITALALEADALIAEINTAPDRRASRPDRVPMRLSRMRQQVDRLSRLISRLLDVSRIATRHLELRLAEVDLAAIVRNAVAQLAAEMARAGCEVQLETAERIVGRWDPLRLGQILTNLLSNAIKYGAGKPIEISVNARGGSADLVVRDHGIGISSRDRERIFECFERAVSLRNYGGLGLGLYITRQLIEAHGGSVRVSSEESKGSTFSVSLPLQPPAQEVGGVAAEK